MLLLALTVGGSLGRHYITMFEATQNVMLKPTESWREALLDTRIMDLFFTVSSWCNIQNPLGYFWFHFLLIELDKSCTFLHIDVSWLAESPPCPAVHRIISRVHPFSATAMTLSISCFHESFPVPRLPLSSYSLYSWPPVCGLFFINKDRQFDFPHWPEKSHLTSSFWHMLGFHLFYGLFFFLGCVSKSIYGCFAAGSCYCVTVQRNFWWSKCVFSSSDLCILRGNPHWLSRQRGTKKCGTNQSAALQFSILPNPLADQYQIPLHYSGCGLSAARSRSTPLCSPTCISLSSLFDLSAVLTAQSLAH